MPAASTKAENKAPLDAGDPMKQILIVIEKKVRNLEKRKGKLDAYKAKQDSGVELEKDQQVAVDKYGEVEQNLLFAIELQKQFAAIGVDAEKFNKKQAKKDRLERQAAELKRVKEMLRVQNLLDSLGSDQVRSDFQKGRHGAVVLSEDNLNQLDELYKLINPSREPNVDYQAQLNAAGDHVINLIDSKEKEVVGTTYKALKELIDDVSNCGYFERALKEENAEECNTEQEFVVVNSQEVPEPDSVEVQSSLPPEPTEQQPEISTETLGNMQDPDSFFSEAPTATQQEVSYQRQRPFQEIVSSVQGNFNFLQESTIDMECVMQLTNLDSPHMDPAVVAAHPMPGRPQSRQAEGGISQTFTNSAFGDVHQQPSSLSQSAENSQQSYSQASVSALSGAGQDFTSQSYGQNSDSLFSEDSISQKVIGQSVPDSTISQFEMPPQRPIPMPQSHDSTQQNSQTSESQSEKKFTMNPNAGVFQSQIYSSSQSQPNDDDSPQNDSSEYQGNSYQSGSNYKGNQGGWKPRGGRGGDRGGMSNGYQGNRNNRGGNFGGNRGGYQGYPPRDNYRPDGYQGFNGNYSGNGGGFKRGGQSRGGPRGAGRGGAPRGGRGGNRGGSTGFGRPAQQAQVS